MISYETSIIANRFTHNTVRNADGTPMRARRNGKTKTWKTRPGQFSIPIKHGLYDYGYITQDNAADWHAAE